MHAGPLALNAEQFETYWGKDSDLLVVRELKIRLSAITPIPVSAAPVDDDWEDEEPTLTVVGALVAPERQSWYNDPKHPRVCKCCGFRRGNMETFSGLCPACFAKRFDVEFTDASAIRSKVLRKKICANCNSGGSEPDQAWFYRLMLPVCKCCRKAGSNIEKKSGFCEGCFTRNTGRASSRGLSYTIRAAC